MTTTARSSTTALLDRPEPRFHDHWVRWRPDWACERPCFYWYLTFDTSDTSDTSDVAGLHHHWRDLLAPLGDAGWLDLSPPRWWHVTLCDVGFGDEVGTGTVTAVAQAVREALADHPPVELTLGPLSPLGTAVALHAGPVDVLSRLQDVVRSTTQAVVGTQRPLVHRDVFRPHLSLAYVNRRVDAREAQATLDALPASATLPVRPTVDRIDLVAVTRKRRHYQWTVEDEVTLGGQRQA